ncbi:lactose permease [Dactylonectria estremocensis]|uniref:Lactose permease n=1 Tax=Dactylonectria estremocensis TaxID=1079267 RepID=A0A9P9ESI6_9HYPO|nr:lactose permease [Dactylonectria estremocensis]
MARSSMEAKNSSDAKAGVGHVHTIMAAPASAALDAITETHKPSLWSHGMMKLWPVCICCYMIASINGFDGSLMGAINAMTEYQKSFGLDGAGSSTGLIFIIYNLGQIASLPFCSLIADRWGRRWGIFIGCCVVLIGTAVQTASQNRAMFMIGRFVLGAGAAISQACGPVYIVEIVHPSYRGVQGGLYNTFWHVGNILAGWTTYGTNLHLDSSWAWRLPTLMQCVLPSIVGSLVFLFPESPRFLIAQDRYEEATAIIAKYHGDGDASHPIVDFQVDEIREQLELNRDPNPWWDLRELFNTRQARYRTAMVILVAFFGQWSGNNVVSYFMPMMLSQAGITNPDTQLLLNALSGVFNFIAAVIGATLADRLGRRKMFLYGLTGALISYILMTAFTARSYDNPDLSYGVIVFIYLFGISFNGGWTSLMMLYPVECLENRTRAKGAAMKYIFLNIATMVNTYGVAVGIKEIGWKLYLVFIIWIAIEIVVIFFFFVETAGKTLEELSVVFEAKNPVKKSLEKIELIVDDRGNAWEKGGELD